MSGCVKAFIDFEKKLISELPKDKKGKVKPTDITGKLLSYDGSQIPRPSKGSIETYISERVYYFLGIFKQTFCSRYLIALAPLLQSSHKNGFTGGCLDGVYLDYNSVVKLEKMPTKLELIRDTAVMIKKVSRLGVTLISSLIGQA